jgi:hypothetical protein
MFPNTLFYLSSSQYGGWVSFTYHLAKILGKDHVLKVSHTFKGGSMFYGDIPYRNVKRGALRSFTTPIITAVDKAHYDVLHKFSNATIVIHDPTELSEQVIAFARLNTVITIRKTVHDLLNSMNIRNTFLKHPFYRYNRVHAPKRVNRSLSRVDFDKNTHIICEANNQGADVEIYGYKNHIYYFHKLKELNFDAYYKGYYPKDLASISQLYAETNFLVDMSVIKKDGGGTQYTFLEAEYHDCGLILHRDWCLVPNSVYKPGQNCYAVHDGASLKDALQKEPMRSSLLPTQCENARWLEIQR